MGWKCSTLIISNVSGEIDYKEVLESIGFSNIEEKSDEPYEIAIYPDNGTIFIGKYKNNLLICESEMAFNCLRPEISKTEQLLIEKFPASEICALSLHSVVNHWGYSIIKNKNKIRARNGDAESGTILDFGEIMEEEKDLLKKSELDSNGNRIYILEDFPDDKMTEDQIGEEFVFEISKRYFGERIDSNDELFEINLKAYQIINKPKLKTINKKQTEKANKWWKFW